MPDQPATAPQSITISLSEMAQKYLGAMQRTYDIASVVVQGTREVNERGYDELAMSARFLPSQKQRRSFDAAKPLAERWVLRNLISDAFGLLVPFLEDTRTICALHEWKAAGSDQGTLPAIFNEQRAEFLKMNIAARLAHLKEAHGLEPQVGEHLGTIEALAACLVRNEGTVPKEGQPLVVKLISLDLIAEPDAAKKVQARVGELRREFAPGSEVRLEKVEHLNVLATISLFMNATLQQLQDKLKA